MSGNPKNLNVTSSLTLLYLFINRVVARVRPQNEMEKERGGALCVRLTDSTVTVTTDDGSMPFTFDRVFGTESTQSEVFEDTALPLINDVLGGYNATVFA